MRPLPHDRQYIALGKLRSAMRRRDERMAKRLSIEPGIVFGAGILRGFRGLKRVGQRFDLQSLHRIGGERPSSGHFRDREEYIRLADS